MASFLSSIATCHLGNQNYDEAIKYFDKSLHINVITLGENHQETISTRDIIGKLRNLGLN